MADEEPQEGVALDDAFGWLARSKAPAVLAALRDPEFARVSASAFSGFRVNASGYNNPLVRRRLAVEATQNEKWAERLKALAEGAPPEVPPPITAAPIETVPKPEKADKTEALRTERNQRRRERDEARAALAEAQQALREADRLHAESQAARAAAELAASQISQRLERLERQNARLRAEQEALTRALRQDKVSSPPRARSSERDSSSAEPSAASPWLDAVRHQLARGRLDLAQAMAEDVLRADSQDDSALEIVAQAQARRGEGKDAALTLRRLLGVRLGQGRIVAAFAALGDLAALPLPAGMLSTEVRRLLPALRLDQPRLLEQARTALVRLEGVAPEAHGHLKEALAALAPPALIAILMPPPGALHLDDPLPLTLPATLQGLTAERLMTAVYSGEAKTVTTLRPLLAKIAGSPTHQRIMDALERACDGASECLAPLLRAPRGPAVLDGSNAAWFGQELLSHPRPRLRPLPALRRTLLGRGYFPVIVYADAPLPYTIDEPDTLKAMIRRNEIRLVDSGVDADEVLLREAKRLEAPLVTNDYMHDWDPNEEVEKLQYAISMDGTAHLIY